VACVFTLMKLETYHELHFIRDNVHVVEQM